MTRVQVQLTEGQLIALKHLAADRGVSISELVRQGVDALLARQDRVARALSAIGRFSVAGPTDTARSHDEMLTDAFSK